jgi:hypothetical protein
LKLKNEIFELETENLFLKKNDKALRKEFLILLKEQEQKYL